MNEEIPLAAEIIVDTLSRLHKVCYRSFFFCHSFLCYWTDEGKKIDAVVVKKSGTPMIYKTKDYTMVVAIDCVKIGFIFRNGKNQTQQ